MDTRPLPAETEPLSRRRSTSVLIRLIADPREGGQKASIRLDALELQSAHERHFTSIHTALAWLAEVLESQANDWQTETKAQLTRAVRGKGRRTQ